jgi:hypothetical protein
MFLRSSYVISYVRPYRPDTFEGYLSAGRWRYGPGAALYCHNMFPTFSMFPKMAS